MPPEASPPQDQVRPEWLGRRTEAILDPELPIVDAHHHLWDRPGSRYLLPDILADMDSGHRIIATVYLQARAMYRATGPEAMRPVGEVEFANGVGAMSASGIYGETKVCAGIVARADLTLGDRVQPVLAALAGAGGARLRGVRHITAWDADASLNNPAYPVPSGLMGERSFREGFAALGKFGLSFDAWLYHPQIDELTSLARAFPGVKIVLDHVGGPLGSGPYRGKRDAVFSRWATSIRSLAAHQNVYVKLGGLGQIVNGFAFNEQDDPPSSESLCRAFRPYIETCIEAFGSARSMFESNFPVDKVAYSYSVFWNACKLLAQGASDAEKADLFSGTATRVYRLVDPA